MKVYQSTDSEYNLRITDENDKDITELLFSSGLQSIDPIRTVAYYVKWNPAEEDCVAEVLSPAAFEFGSTSDVVISETLPSTTGSYTYSIVPASMTQMEVENDPFKEKVQRLPTQWVPALRL